MANILYRLGSNTPMNFTARPIDTVGTARGLSLSDLAPAVPGPRAQEINSTLLVAPMAAVYTPYRDPHGVVHPDHYSIRPEPDPGNVLLPAWAATRAGIMPNSWPPPANPTISANTYIVRNARINQIN